MEAQRQEKLRVLSRALAVPGTGALSHDEETAIIGNGETPGPAEGVPSDDVETAFRARVDMDKGHPERMKSLKRVYNWLSMEREDEEDDEEMGPLISWRRLIGPRGPALRGPPGPVDPASSAAAPAPVASDETGARAPGPGGRRRRRTRSRITRRRRR